MKKDPYEVLKIEREASLIEIERAYHKSMLNYGFDPRVAYSVEEREKINNVISEIEEAYKTLSSPEKNQKRLSDEISMDEQADTIPAEIKGNGTKKEKGGMDLSSKGTYDQYFGFKESPFNLTPDTKYFYLSAKHKEALAHLFFGLQEQKGFVVITGEVGTGKTMLCRSFLAQLDASVKVAYLFNPCLSDLEILQSINAEFGLPSESQSKKELLGEFNQFLLRARREGEKVALVVDEAQDLEIKTLEQLRLLSNLETETEKLLQIVLVGQPELLNTLKTHGLRQLEQRITVRWSLSPLDLEETQSYIHHRLKVAHGWGGKVDFTSGAVRQIYKASKGVPRMINVFSDRALLVAYTLGRKSVNRKIVSLAISNYYQDAHTLPKPFPRAAGMVITLILSLFFTLYMGPWGFDYLKSSDMDRFVSKLKTALGLEKASEWALGLLPMGDKKTGLEALSPRADKKEKEKAPAQQKTAAVEPAPPAPPSPQEKEGAEAKLLNDLKNRSMEQGQLNAFNAVLEMWGAPAISETGRKNFLKGTVLGEGLRLLAFEGDFEKIKMLGYPIVLELNFSEGREKRYFPLRRVSGENILAGAGQAQEIPFASIQKFWSGKCLVVWKDFENLSYNIKEKDTGPQVLWLQEGLEKLGLFKARKTSFFGTMTVDAVVAFQKRHGMAPDGVVGPEMKMKLYKLLGYHIP
ncbi:MAG: AAA family ATPase [Nitrospinae bacterium]|nr:AAA family ATPase [Nitrospinota bacterium]